MANPETEPATSGLTPTGRVLVGLIVVMTLAIIALLAAIMVRMLAPSGGAGGATVSVQDLTAAGRITAVSVSDTRIAIVVERPEGGQSVIVRPLPRDGVAQFDLERPAANR
ncbi:MAG: hypothetical protein ACFB2Z_15045 [Maricaulaceae bacterium]